LPRFPAIQRTRVGIPLKCFAGAGANMGKLTAVGVESMAGYGLAISEVGYGTVADHNSIARPVTRSFRKLVFFLPREMVALTTFCRGCFQMTVTAGIDAGTQSVKVVIYDDETAKVLASVNSPLELTSGDDGTRDSIPMPGWKRSRHALVPSTRIAPPGRGPRCIRTAAWIRADRRRRRSPGAGEALVRYQQHRGMSRNHRGSGRGGGSIALAGNPILCRIHGLQAAVDTQASARSLSSLATILLPHDYLNFWLTGQAFCEYGDASGTGWFDVRRRQWSPVLLNAIDPHRDLGACLPPLVATETMFPIRAERAEALGLSPGVFVAVAVATT
jgi:xylulokinase